MSDLMTRVHDLRGRSLPEGLRLAIVGLKGGLGGMHVGIIFKDDGELKFLHLGWHHRVFLHSESQLLQGDGRLFLVTLLLEEEQEDYFFERLRLIARENRRYPSIPYGLSFTDGRLTEKGRYESKKDCGLTCATFVLAAFEAVGYPLAAVASWQNRKEQDEPFQKRTLDKLRDYRNEYRQPDFDAHLERFEQDIGCTRIRPEEVAAAGTAPIYPADFTYCEQSGLELRSMFLPFDDRVVVVVGASGVVGSGIVRKYLDAGATVVAVLQSMEELSQFEQMQIEPSRAFLPIVGDFKDEASASEVKKAVAAAIKDKQIDHVVSVQGVVTLANAPTGTPPEQLKTALDDGFRKNLLAAKAFLPELKSREGSSFTLVSGGLAHVPPATPSLGLDTMKDASINALTLALAAETAGDKVRVNTICIHFGVAPAGGNKDQFGMNADGDTLRLAPVFLGLARGTQKGLVHCLGSWAEADKFASG